MRRKLMIGALGVALGIGLFARAEPQDLAGTIWVAVEVAGVDALAQQVPDVSFEKDGSAFGTSGCNRFNGTYEQNGAELRFGPLASTRMACHDELGAQEQAYFAALSQVAGWRLDESNLVLVSDNGDQLAKFERTSAE
ncbi:MAG: META domain-containing protein [Shimia sp.]|jgi:putative lipoprotein|uniref:META domain-containing protein n=1 Tax=Shimia sp. TaxID=1954381 RepID=UPI004059EAA3